ncbi:MAG: hypothetical protein IKW58_02090 [Alphaproteobacteria bacterium]|nr:hypothetical protein [Alphaproteobacteria bacterium]
MSYGKLFLLLTASFIINQAITEKTALANTENNKETSKIYLLKHTKCRYRKKDRVTYCVDAKNKPITGEIRLYEDGEIIRSIPVTQGLIDGTMKSFETNGDKRYIREYKKGRLHGIEETYYPENKVEKIIPYVNGYKEGVAKEFYPNGYMSKQYTYVEDKLDGKMRTYTNDGKVLYNIITANDKYVEATCNYLNQDNKISAKQVPAIVLEAVNEGCGTLGEELKTNYCSITISSDIEGCDLSWIKKNEEELKRYIKILPPTTNKDNTD